MRIFKEQSKIVPLIIYMQNSWNNKILAYLKVHFVVRGPDINGISQTDVWILYIK